MLKQKTLETAHDIFYQHGFHACGVELLAREAGTTKRTLYAHFGSKDRLIEAVLNYQNKQFIKCLKKTLGQYQVRSLHQGLFKIYTSVDTIKEFLRLYFY